MQLTFLGAARTVTGSRYFLDTGKKKILIECGLFQERDLKIHNWDAFPIPPKDIDCVLLTHGHLDHCGLLPKLVKEGFKGKIYCTETTVDVAKIVMLDSAKLQEEDVAYKIKRHAKKGKTPAIQPVPLYTMRDVEATSALFAGVPYDEPVDIGDAEATFMEAGHILGSATIMLEAGNGQPWKKILFSGDVGRPHTAILREPEPLEETDYVLIESTYGNRVHRDSEAISDLLAKYINETIKAGGNVVIPSFAVERAQELLYRLHVLRRDGRIPRVPVYLDSPMAVQITEILKKHPEVMNEESSDMIEHGENPFDFKGLHLCSSVDDSKAINEVKGGAIIIAGSGMCTGGRVKHHLVQNIGRPESMILFVGYQAAGTLGRQILEREKEVRILGEVHKVLARIEKINGFSAHAGQDELLKWLLTLKREPKCVFVVHGESQISETFARFITENTGGWNVMVPTLGEKVEL